MKKLILSNKLVFITLILMFAIYDVKAAFPDKFNTIENVTTQNSDSGMSNRKCYDSSGTRYTCPSSPSKGYEEWKSNYKKGTGSDDKTYVVICANHEANSPAGNGVACSKITTNTYSDAIKSGVAAIINKAGPFSLTSNGKCYYYKVDNKNRYLAEGETGCVNEKYVQASITISKFLYEKGASSDPKNKGTAKGSCKGGCPSDWLTAASNAYNAVKTAEDKAKNDTFVSIDNVTIDEHDDEFILSFSVPSIYTIDSINVSKGSKQAEGIYKILKSDLDEGDNSVTITVDASYTVAVAEFYDCGWKNASSPYQLITPAYTEDKKVVKDTVTKDITLTKQTKGTIELIKENTSGTKILAKDVGIQLYDGYNCTIGNENNEYTSFQSGNKLSLEAGNYSIKETTAPSGYEKDDNCYNFTISAGHTAAPITITNQSTCVSDVLDLIQSGKANDRSERIKIFKNYNPNLDSEVKIYANLLNFDLTYNGGDNTEFANSLCSNPTNCGSVNINCLYASTSTNFNANNLSCYNSTQKINNNTGFCYTSFGFNRNTNISVIESENYYILNNSVKSGQFVFKSDYIGTATLSRSCYFDEEVGYDKIDDKAYDNYVEYVNFNGQSMEKSSNPKLVLEKVSSNFFSGTADIEYKTVENWVEKISGKKCTAEQIENDKDSKIKICQNIGRGFISDFNDIKKASSNIVLVPFSIKFNGNEFSTRSCAYSIIPEVIKYEKSDIGILEIEFRTVDTNNPFNRNTKSNWSGTTNSSTNNKVQQYITNSDVNNSYNRTGAGSLYTNQTDGTKRIILTPSLIQIIREYNDGTGEGDCANTNPSYNDYTVHKEENDDGTETTTTNFFKCIGLTKVQ